MLSNINSSKAESLTNMVFSYADEYDDDVSEEDLSDFEEDEATDNFETFDDVEEILEETIIDDEEKDVDE